MRRLLFLAALTNAQKRSKKCRNVEPLPPIRERHDLGGMLRARGLTGHGVELGVRDGRFTATLLRGWRQADSFVQVDAWRPLGDGAGTERAGDSAQRDSAETHARHRQRAKAVLDAAVALGYAKSGEQCANRTEDCADLYPNDYFDFVYVDASHDRIDVLMDLHLWWPKVKNGGVMAGHDYTEHREPAPHAWAYGVPSDDAWPEPFDGDHAVSVSVDDDVEHPVETRFGESRVDAALRFLEGRDLSGAGCARGNQTCMAEALVAMDWASQYPVREFHEGGFTDPCLPAFGVNGCGMAFDPHTAGEDWSEHPRAVRGAVDDFFSGTAYAAPDLQKCPRQVVVTYRERGWNSWMVAK